jgi:predicted nucleic acid-binding protein
VRSLDAIHLATALRVRPASFVAYDKRLADAARTAGLSVEMPGT